MHSAGTLVAHREADAGLANPAVRNQRYRNLWRHREAVHPHINHGNGTEPSCENMPGEAEPTGTSRHLSPAPRISTAALCGVSPAVIAAWSVVRSCASSGNASASRN
jgi:hypothetical protein